MNKLIIAGIIALFASSANANINNVEGRIIAIDPVYTKVYQQEPQQKCQDVEVPIYGKNSDNGSAIIGGILGGVLGNQFGNGSGKDAMTGIGAITGAIIGGNSTSNRVITGYRVERQCTTTYRNVNKSIVNEYDITYRVQGQQITVRVNRVQGERAWIGQSKRFRVTYQLLN